MQITRPTAPHLEIIAPTAPNDWYLLVTDGCGHYATYRFSELDAALADGSITAMENCHLELLAADIPPTFDTLARIHAEASAAVMEVEVTQ